jgi:hypothetical protein
MDARSSKWCLDDRSEAADAKLCTAIDETIGRTDTAGRKSNQVKAVVQYR